MISRAASRATMRSVRNLASKSGAGALSLNLDFETKHFTKEVTFDAQR